jgi:hypothetical protein
VASEAVAWRACRAGVVAVTRGAGSGGELAWSEQRWLSAIVLRAVGRRRQSETDWVSTVALGRAQFGAQYRFAIIQTLLRFENTK